MPGGGGLGFDEISTIECDADLKFPRRLATEGTTGAEGAAPGGGGGAPPGSRGAAPGGLGGAPPGGALRFDSGSDM